MILVNDRHAVPPSACLDRGVPFRLGAGTAVIVVANMERISLMGWPQGIHAAAVAY
jgi:hypothetical protein